MKRITITALAALTLLGTSVAAFASSDRNEHRYYRGDDWRGAKKCSKNNKRCWYRYRRYHNHEWREHRYGHDDHYRRYGKRRWRYDD